MKKQQIMPILIMLAGLTALSTDIYLPSMPALSHDLQTSPGLVEMTLSVFIIAFAVGQLIYGPLSDRLGRRKPLIAGLSLYLFANGLCALAGDISVLLVGRTLQGLGAAAGMVSCLAIVRDRFDEVSRTGAMARIASVTCLAPILAPILGGWLQTHYNWQASFIFLTIFSFGLTVLVLNKLPETAPPYKPASLLQTYRRIPRNPQWLGWTVVTCFSFTALFAFIASSSNLMVGQMGITPQMYGVLFASNAVTYLLGSALLGRISHRITNISLSLWGSAHVLLGGLAMLVLAVEGVESVMAVLVPMYSVTFGVSLLNPPSAAGALEPFPDAAGAASALQGFARFSIAGISITMLGMFPTEGALGLSLLVGLAGAICLTATLMLGSLNRIPENEGTPVTA